jgi:kynurenine formamidase
LHEEKDRCYLAKEGAESLVKKRIKMVGFDDTVFPENPQYAGKYLSKYLTHDLMLSNNIPIIEGLTNSDKLKQKMFLLFGFPAKLGGLEAFPIRAVSRSSKKF